MKTIIKKGFKLIFTHLMALALAVFFIFVFSWLIEKKGFFPFSIIMMPFYIGLFYSEGWNWGRLEGRKYNEIKENPLRALAASVIPSIIPIVFMLLTAFGVNHILLGVIEKIWYFPFAGFFHQQDLLTVSEIFWFGIIIPVVVTIAYYVGTKNFSILEKIAFRKNFKREQERKAQMNKQS